MENCESSPSGSDDLFGSLEDVLITNILSRIPTRQLSECSAVCKRWHSLIRTPRFVQEHEKRHASSSVPLVHRGFEQEAESQLLFLKDEETRRSSSSECTLFQTVHLNGDTEKKMSWPLCQLRASYHGLLLFQEHPFKPTHFILNPLTREAVTFNNPDQTCGLYYHPPSSQYRLLCFRKVTTANTGTGTSSSFLYYVCSISQELVKEVGTYDSKIDIEEGGIDMEDLVKNFSTCRAVLYPGVHNIPAVAAGSYLYWPVYDYNKSAESDRHIMAFDVMNETLQLMPHPKGHPASGELSLLLQHWTTRFFEMENRLHLHVTMEDRGMEVWALEDHNTWRWAKVIAPDGMDPDGMNVGGVRRPNWNRLPLTVEDGELLYLLPQRGVFRTNSHTKQVELIGDGGDIGRCFSYCMVNWRRSLVSFKHYL